MLTKSPRVNLNPQMLKDHQTCIAGILVHLVFYKNIVFLQQYLYDSIPMLKSSIFIFMFIYNRVYWFFTTNICSSSILSRVVRSVKSGVKM